MSLLLVAGDTHPDIQVTLTDQSGAVVNLTGTTIRLYFRISGSTVQSRVMTPAADPTTGIASYQFQDGDLTPGDLVGEFEITYSNGTVMTSALTFSASVRMRTYGPVQPGALSRLVTLGPDSYQIINGELGPVSFGTPVYMYTQGSFKMAVASAMATSDVIGIVTDASVAAGFMGTILGEGYLGGTASQWATITGETNGLTFGRRYFLNPITSGKMVQEGYTFLAGQVAIQLGTALSDTVFKIEIEEPILM